MRSARVSRADVREPLACRRENRQPGICSSSVPAVIDPARHEFEKLTALVLGDEHRVPSLSDQNGVHKCLGIGGQAVKNHFLCVGWYAVAEARAQFGESVLRARTRRFCARATPAHTRMVGVSYLAGFRGWPLTVWV